MCNGYPALRCSRHAKDLLEHAEKKLSTVTTWDEQEEAEKILNHATKLFYTTPAGFKELELKLLETTDVLEKDKLFATLQEGKFARKNAQIEYNRIHRVNKEKIDNAQLLRSKGLPWWVIASQLNVDTIEKNESITLKNKDVAEVNSEDVDGTYFIDVRKQQFIITTKNEKYLSINNRHSLLIYEEIYRDSINNEENNIKNVTNKYLDRGENKAIEYNELLPDQKNILWSAITAYFNNNQFTHVAVSDPRIGISKIITIEDLPNHFEPTLHTVLKIRNGTDRISNIGISKFNESRNKKLIPDEATLVKDKYLIETSRKLSDKERIHNEYIFIPVKDNIYEVKKLGNIRGESIRVVLTLNGD
jgi:hypothetical protein